MVDVPADAPNFTVPRVQANGDTDLFTLTDGSDEAPFVFVFFPAAFTGDAAEELDLFQQRLDDFREAGGTVYAVSIDAPPTLRQFKAENGFDFGFLSDHQKVLIDKFDVRTNHDDPQFHGVAEWAVFVVNSALSVSYRWEADEDVVRFSTGEILEVLEKTS